jgi:tetratricopeptide (TPR) repeat protein
MQRNQIIAIVFFLGLFSILYFACDTKDSKQKAMEKSRAQNIELINIERLKAEAVSQLGGPSRLIASQLVDSLEMASLDEEKTELLEKLASLWYNQQRPLISAHYAEQLAQLNNSEEAWQIAGTSYLIAAQRLQIDREQEYAIQKSRQALEKALSFNAENIENRINLALSYVEMPEESNPMKGILMLVELNKQNPDNIPVLIQLGRLALGTNQMEKAVERLSRVIELDSNNRQAHCYLEEIYTKQGKLEEAERERIFCEIN